MDLQQLLFGAQAGLSSPFPPTSRYHGIEVILVELTDGRKTACIRRRFLPQPEQMADLGEHVVTQGDRLDNVTFRYLGDAEQFWRLCDANRAMQPEELTETIGRRLRITLPEGVPGVNRG